jgi:hypothetical protein
VEDRISRLDDKIDIKEKAELLDKTQELWKEYARTQQLHQKIKSEIMGIEEGEEAQGKGYII